MIVTAANMKPRRGKKDYSGLEYHCLVRATDGRRKLTTQVQGKDLAKFQDSYTTIQRVRGCGQGWAGCGLGGWGVGCSGRCSGRCSGAPLGMRAQCS